MTHAAQQVGRTVRVSRRPNPTGGAVATSIGDRPARSTPGPVDAPISRHRGATEGPSGWVLVIGVTGLAFTIGAYVLEVVSSRYANSTVPGWAHWVPLAWPQHLRVVWWLAVAAAAAAFRWSLARIGLRPNRVVTVLTVGPILAFAAGVAAGAEWATWH